MFLCRRYVVVTHLLIGIEELVQVELHALIAGHIGFPVEDELLDFLLPVDFEALVVPVDVGVVVVFAGELEGLVPNALGVVEPSGLGFLQEQAVGLRVLLQLSDERFHIIHFLGLFQSLGRLHVGCYRTKLPLLERRTELKGAKIRHVGLRCHTYI